MTFIVGKSYNRRNDIHGVYGGQMQGGISTPAKHPYIFIFTGQTGSKYGYEDGWQNAEGIFLYTGQGQIGDMEFSAGNKALKNHIKNGKTILLFEIVGKGNVIHIGSFECSSFDFKKGLDRKDNSRQIIRFHLIPITDGIEENTQIPNEKQEEVERQNQSLSFEELRQKAISAASTPHAPDWKTANTIRRKRSKDVKDYVLTRANGRCELTGEPAPFIRKKSGVPFLEVHHISRLSDEGLDNPINCAAITPNIHREIHHGERGNELNLKLLGMIKNKEQDLDNQ